MEASNRRGYNKGLFVSEEGEKKKRKTDVRDTGGVGVLYLLFLQMQLVRIGKSIDQVFFLDWPNPE